MTFDSNLERINFIMGLLINASDDVEGHPFTIRDVAENFNLPIDVLRNDLAFLCTQPFYGNMSVRFSEVLKTKSGLRLLSETDEEDTYTALAELYMYRTNDDKKENVCIDVQRERLSEEIKAGIFDDMEIWFDTNREDYRLPLSNTEKAIVGGWFSDISNMFIMKDMPPQATKKLEKSIKKLNEIIEYKYMAEFDYKTGSGKTNKNQKIRPVEIWINSENPGDAVCIASNGVIFRIDRMTNITKITDIDCEDCKKPDFHDDRDAIWWLPSGQNTVKGTTQHVVLRIDKGTSNIAEKIKSDTSRRINGSLRDSGNDIMIYEDDISGFNDFKLWLWRYGSAVKVIEPKWLADEIAADYERMRNQYETGEFVR